MKTSKEYMKQLREQAGLSQVQLSEALGYTTPQFISNWERGVSHPPVSQIKKIATLLKTDPQAMFDVILNDVLISTREKYFRKFGRKA